MRCHVCGHTRSKVLDSRPVHGFAQIRRRRECLACQSRFTTQELLEVSPLMVIKKNGRLEKFSREKLLGGLKRAAEKRPIPEGKLEELVDAIRAELSNSLINEVPFQVVGEMVLERLLELDKIAYVRFVSVYRDFKNPRDFLLELQHLFNLDPAPLVPTPEENES